MIPKCKEIMEEVKKRMEESKEDLIEEQDKCRKP